MLRPLFPVKPAAPFNGELIVIGDDLALRSAKKPLMHHRGPGTVASAWSAGYGLCHDATRGVPWSHEPGNVIETHEHNMDLVEAYGVSAALAFILDSACQRAYKALS